MIDWSSIVDCFHGYGLISFPFVFFYFSVSGIRRELIVWFKMRCISGEREFDDFLLILESE